MNPLAQDLEQHVDIFSCSDAPEQNDLASWGQLPNEPAEIPRQGFAITGIVILDVNLGELAQVGEGDRGRRRDQPMGRSNDENTGEIGPSEDVGLGKSSPKIEPTEKSEGFA